MVENKAVIEFLKANKGKAAGIFTSQTMAHLGIIDEVRKEIVTILPYKKVGSGGPSLTDDGKPILKEDGYPEICVIRFIQDVVINSQ